MVELEREKTYLLKELPKDLASCKSEIIRDIFVPASARHPYVRLRQRGDHYEITKKAPVESGDASRQEENTIPLSKEEFEALAAAPGKSFVKRRYYCIIDSHMAEVDVYGEALEGLAVIDFEFDTDEALDQFVQPAICLADVTQEESIAGGMLAGKRYEDLAGLLESHNYKPLKLEER